MILITGLTGTSGSAFYDVLCREHFNEKIRVVTRGRSNPKMLENSPLNIEYMQGDITDLDFMISAMAGCDTIFHIAHKEKLEYIAQAIMQSPQVRYVICVSSTIVYSNCYPRLNLKQIEPKIKDMFRSRGIKYVFIRPTMIFGTPKDCNISTFIRWFQKYPVFPIVKKGSATIQPVCRLDLAEAYWTILKNKDRLSRDEYVISGKEKMTLLEMFQTITDLLDKKVYFINIPFPLAKLLVLIVYYATFKKVDYREKLDRLTEDRAYDHNAFKDEFGYEPLSFRDRAEPLVKQLKSEHP